MGAIERLRQFIDYKRISKYQFYKKTGLANGYLDRNGSIGSDKCEIIIEQYPEIRLEWLILGKGAMLHGEDTQLATPKIEAQFSLRTDKKVAMQNVPLYELDATAGLVALFSEASRQVPISHLQIPDLPPCDGAIYVRGDSMYPLLKSGDIVLYKEIPGGSSSILWGEMYLLSFVLEGETYITIKYIQKADDERFVRLVSHNPHHSPKDIPADSIRALALVKASVRFNTLG
ncbi:S24 family peptidase [Alistipes sp.]|uniref:S24 family peptidase n=1 Tax=Alistipes sp. TaxID=1872444 RepID=UPI003AF07BFA